MSEWLERWLGLDISKLMRSLIPLVISLTWYSIVILVMKNSLQELGIEYIGRVTVYGVYTISLILTSVVCCFIVDKRDKLNFAFSWMILALIGSFIFLLFSETIQTLILYALLGGISLGMGLPIHLGTFVEETSIENRGRVGGLVYFTLSILLPFLGVLVETVNLKFFSIFSVFWIGIWLLIIITWLRTESTEHSYGQFVSFRNILLDRQFYLYFFAFLTYWLIDTMEVPILKNFLEKTFGIEFVNLMLIIGTLVTAFFSIIAGFIADVYGRKKVLIYGYLTLGIAYLIVSVASYSPISWYVYFVINEITSCLFFVIFIFTIWGDISLQRRPERYYTLGSIPFFTLIFIRELLSPYLFMIPIWMAFSFAGFFLFVAIIPLLSASETLPEKEIRRRELRKYLEKAKKLREKYERKND